MAERNASVIIEATLVWPFLTKLNTMSQKYSVDLANLSESDVDKLVGLDLQMKNESKADAQFDRGTYITVSSQNPITRVSWQDRTALSDDELAATGNGTVVKAQVSFYDWNFQGKKGRSASLVGMVDLSTRDFTS